MAKCQIPTIDIVSELDKSKHVRRIDSHKITTKDGPCADGQRREISGILEGEGRRLPPRRKGPKTLTYKGKYFGQYPPGGWDEISKYPENGEKIRVFYCLALKNGEEIYFLIPCL